MIFSEIILTSQYGGGDFHSSIENDFRSRQREIFFKLDKTLFLGLVDAQRLDERHTRYRLFTASQGQDNSEKVIEIFCSLFSDYSFRFEAQSEITAKTFVKKTISYGSDVNDLLNEVGINTALGIPHHDEFWNEFLVTKGNSTLSSSSYLYGQDFQEELSRIKAHPTSDPLDKKVIHYVFESGENLEAIEVLIDRLFTARRIQSRRVAVFESKSSSANRALINNLESLCSLSTGGTVLVKFPELIGQGELLFGDSNELLLAKMASLFQVYRDKVQFIFSIPNERFSETLSDYFPHDKFVQFRTNQLTKQEATYYLQVKAKEDGVETIDSLLSMLSGTQNSYSGKELLEIYQEWSFLREVNTAYPEYQKYFERALFTKKQTSVISAHEQLQSLIGLTETKKLVLQSINLLKFQALRKKQGIASESPNRHMVFTGNPGTGKTTVAHLFADILREEGILSKGLLIDGARANLVGRYVGQTAPLVKAAFQRAKGSVLFIDEAYSFVDEVGGYGSEAIATIVEEMENHREDTVVIFAGYKDPMKRFIESNEGLRSRIGFTIDFPDYDSHELMQIMLLNLQWKGYRITPKTEEFLQKFFKKIKMDKTSGNARLVRNLIEKAEFRMSNRLISKNPNERDIKTLMTMKKEDFIEETERLMRENSSSERQIGFKKS
ncbi:MAG: AAA family ATPase [Streptococcaceae bacterium]|jgi:AAA+ superfamily predicted ATPase|nr:AAA family ATPase [Streptococcaceae bacterium]